MSHASKETGELSGPDLAMCPITRFHVFFDMLLEIGFSEDIAARLAAGHGWLTPIRRDERIEVART